MIILRQREFGRTGLSKDQAKEWFKGGQGKMNKLFKRSYEWEEGAKKELNNAGVNKYSLKNGFKTKGLGNGGNVLRTQRDSQKFTIHRLEPSIDDVINQNNSGYDDVKLSAIHYKRYKNRIK